MILSMKKRNSLQNIILRIQRAYYRNVSSEKILRRAGMMWSLDPRDKLQNMLMAGRVFEEYEIERCIRTIKEIGIDVFVDIGANFGLYTVLVGGNNPSVEIISFEPAPKTYMSLRENIRLNELDKRVQVWPVALSNVISSAEMKFDPLKSGGAHIVHESIHKDGTIIKVETDMLDNRCDLRDKRCLIKIDVEGHAGSVIEGARITLLRNWCIVQVEVWERERERVDKLFVELGYNLFDARGHNYYYSNFT